MVRQLVGHQFEIEPGDVATSYRRLLASSAATTDLFRRDLMIHLTLGIYRAVSLRSTGSPAIVSIPAVKRNYLPFKWPILFGDFLD